MSVLFHENPGTSLGEVKFVGNETDDTGETPDWITDFFPNNTIIDSEAHQAIRGFCRIALLYEVPGIGVRYWDLAILLPNLLFFIFLLFKLRPVINKLSTSNSPVYKAFFILVYLTTFLNIARCAISIGFSITDPVGEMLDRVLWLSLKFFSMTAELSVLTFALLFGHLDSSTSIRRALLITLLVSLAHTAVQTVLELRLLHNSLVDDLFFDLHSQGGLVFWFLTSVTFAVVYLFVSCLPLTCCRNYVSLPSKCSFYWYCAFLFLMNCFQALGVVFIFFKLNDGYCVTIFTTFVYFTFLPPVIYFTFLRSLLKRPASTSTGLFSYRKQKDEGGTNDMPPYFPRFSGLTSPSYDDLFDLHRGNRFVDYDYTRDYLQCPYDTPLMASEPAESTVTTRTAGSDEGHQRDSQVFGSIELGQHTRHPTSHLKGLGANGTLIFEDSRWK